MLWVLSLAIGSPHPIGLGTSFPEPNVWHPERGGRSLPAGVSSERVWIDGEQRYASLSVYCAQGVPVVKGWGPTWEGEADLTLVLEDGAEEVWTMDFDGRIADPRAAVQALLVASSLRWTFLLDGVEAVTLVVDVGGFYEVFSGTYCWR